MSGRVVRLIAVRPLAGKRDRKAVFMMMLSTFGKFAAGFLVPRGVLTIMQPLSAKSGSICYRLYELAVGK
jgi:hypothetical protein